MARLTARENRYFLSTDDAEAIQARRIPAARPLPEGRGFVLPRKPGVILALDRVFGPDGWEPTGDAAQDAREARGRVYDPAREPADLSLEGAWFVIRCAIADKELVKKVPGYRWDPRRQRWFVPAVPVALDMLRDGFSELRVDAEAAATIELRRIDEQRALEQAQRAAALAPPARALEVGRPGEESETPTPAEGQDVAPALPVTSRPPADAAPGPDLPEALLTRFDRLLNALERLVERLEPTAAAPRLSASDADEPLADEYAAAAASDVAPGEEDWRDFLDRFEATPDDGVVEAIDRARQAASPATWDAVAGILGTAAGQPEVARQHLRRALHQAALDPELQVSARSAYVAASVALVARTLGASESIRSVQDFRAALAREILSGEGIDAAALTGSEVRDVVATLIDDPLLRELSATLADAVRVLDLLVGVRNEAPGIVDRLERFLVREDTTGDAFGLTLVVAAAHVAGVRTATETIDAWPEDDMPAGLRISPARAKDRLQDIEDAAVRGAAARAALLLSAGDGGDDSLDGDRRALLRMVQRIDAGHEHASFLAWFPVAAHGGAIPEDRREAYLAVLGKHPLRRTRDHIERMFAEGDASDRRSIVHYVAEGALIPALAHGVEDPQSEVIDLLDVFETGETGPMALGTLARAVDRETFPGADRFGLEQRVEVFRRALKSAVAKRRKELALEGLARLTAILWECDRVEDIERVALGCLRERWAPIRVPASIVLAEAMAVRGSNPDDMLGSLHDCLQGARDDERRAVLLEVADLVPEAAARIREELGSAIEERSDEHQPALAGCRVLVVGGHDRLRQAATPVLERWGAKVDWLNPDQTKQGERAVTLARGACTHVVVNTSYISHAASGRVIEAAAGMGKRVIYHDGRGVGSTLRILGEQLGERPAVGVAADPKPTKADARRKLAGLRGPQRHR
jgi:hypothetical protein